MALYKTGTVSVTNGSNIVTGSGTSWSTEVSIGDSFKVTAENAIYTVNAVNSNTEIALNVNYAGTTGSGKAYSIGRDFTPTFGFPETDSSDADLPFRVTDALRAIDSKLDTGSGSGIKADTVDGFHASATPALNAIPVGGASGKLANDVDTVDGYHADATATQASKIPVRDGTGRLVKGDQQSNTAYKDEANIFTTPQTIQGASAMLVVNAASGNPVVDYQISGTSKAYVGYTPSTDAIFLYDSDGSAIRVSFDMSNGKTTAGVVSPTADNTYSCGESGARWTAVWAVNGTIQTSDERQKKDIQGSSLGLDFIKSLRPVSYKWIVGGNTVETVEDGFEEVEEHDYVEVERPVSEVKIIDGKAVKTTRMETVREYFYDRMPLFDEAGKPVMEKGKQAVAEVPRMKTVQRPKFKQAVIPREGARRHWGLLAQEVKGVCDRLGIDFGGWIQTDPDNPESDQGLRYDQFIAPLIKAVQELEARVKVLEG